MNNNIIIPETALVLLVGISSSGKSSFAKKHFLETEVISSDTCRAMIVDDPNDQNITPEAFDLLHTIAAKRLRHHKLVVIDATNIQYEARQSLLKLAKKCHAIPVAIVLNTPHNVCLKRHVNREDRHFPPQVLKSQQQDLKRTLKSIKRERFRYVYVLEDEAEIENVTIERQRLWIDLKHETGPFDIIGDIHGCFDECHALLLKLGYEVHKEVNTDTYQVSHPQDRRVIFLGDLVDRGPKTPEVLRLVMSMVECGIALCVAGNHDAKLMRALKGNKVKIAHGLDKSLEQLKLESDEFIQKVINFLDSLVSHYVLDGGNLVVAHAGMKEKYQGRASGTIRAFALYGDTTGEMDEFGLPVRQPWAAEYRGHAMVVYGHTPVPKPQWINKTINIDTGCVFGGKLTALRYPERDLISLPAHAAYSDPIKPLANNRTEHHLTILDLQDVIGKRLINTRLTPKINISEERASAAIETMSRFAIDPRALIYLPPTMAPCETSTHQNVLEHPNEAFEYYRNHQIAEVICQEKHMGSRAIVVVCRDPEVMAERFHITSEQPGFCYTRTGRPLFADPKLTGALLERLQNAIKQSHLWDTLESDWICFDCEIMPWSAKAKSLLQRQYAPVAASGIASLEAAIQYLHQTMEAGVNVSNLLEKYHQRLQMIEQYQDTYRRYCWDTSEIDDYCLAPFHILASDKAVHMDKPHSWHMTLLDKLCDFDPVLLRKTQYKVIDIEDSKAVSEVVAWWHELTEKGGEGIVIKPLAFTALTDHGVVQPGIKCRGREYLRIIYGPEYTAPEHLQKLKFRNTARKKALALKEYSLGYEALHRFVEREPLYRVHETVFAILALESEPVDPRL